MVRSSEEKRAALNNDVSSQFLLKDVVVVSSSCKRHRKFADAPSGTFDIEFAMRIHPENRQKVEGVAVQLRCTANGFGKGPKDGRRGSKSFSAELELEGFFKVTEDMATVRKDVTASQMYFLAVQLHPLVVCKVREAIASMGYRGLDLPFELTQAEMKPVADAASAVGKRK